MSIITLYGINGVGKDTIANSVRNSESNLKVSSMSRMLMYILGITSTYDVNEEVNEKQYQQLESMSQTKMIEIEQTDYKRLLCDISESKQNLLFLSHLITALRHGDKINYLVNRKTPDWFVDINSALVQLVAPVEVICERRTNDKTRKRVVDPIEVSYHQQLCTEEWERIKRINTASSDKMYVVNNIDLDTATNEVKQILHKKMKVLKK